jgi:hypothetical protein
VIREAQAQGVQITDLRLKDGKMWIRVIQVVTPLVTGPRQVGKSTAAGQVEQRLGWPAQTRRFLIRSNGSKPTGFSSATPASRWRISLRTRLALPQ